MSLASGLNKEINPECKGKGEIFANPLRDPIQRPCQAFIAARNCLFSWV